MFRWTRAVSKAGFPILRDYFNFMRPCSKHPDKKPIEYRYFRLRKTIKTALNALKCELFIEGIENLPKDCVYFLCSNHLSMADPLIYASIIDKPTSFVSKIESEKFPFIGKCIRCVDGEFLDRDDLKQSLRVMMRIEKDLKGGVKNWIIFPEGTRNKDPLENVKDFHHGTFRAAMKAEVPIVPAAIYGSFRVFKFSPQFKSYPVHVSFLKPLMPEEYKNMNTNDVAKNVHDEIQKEVSFKLRKFDHEKMSALKSKNYRSYKI